MGMYDTVLVPCPECEHENEIQSKAGRCMSVTYRLDMVPRVVLDDIEVHGVVVCPSCGHYFDVLEAVRRAMRKQEREPL